MTSSLLYPLGREVWYVNGGTVDTFKQVEGPDHLKLISLPRHCQTPLRGHCRQGRAKTFLGLPNVWQRHGPAFASKEVVNRDIGQDWVW